MIKAIKQWFSPKNKISYVHVVYWFDYKSEKGRNLAFRDKEGKAGFIKRLTGVEALGELFDVQGAFVRVFRCPRESFPSLRQYCARLAA